MILRNDLRVLYDMFVGASSQSIDRNNFAVTTLDQLSDDDAPFVEWIRSQWQATKPLALLLAVEDEFSHRTIEPLTLNGVATSSSWTVPDEQRNQIRVNNASLPFRKEQIAQFISKRRHSPLAQATVSIFLFRLLFILIITIF